MKPWNERFPDGVPEDLWRGLQTPIVGMFAFFSLFGLLLAGGTPWPLKLVVLIMWVPAVGCWWVWRNVIVARDEDRLRRGLEWMIRRTDTPRKRVLLPIWMLGATAATVLLLLAVVRVLD